MLMKELGAITVVFLPSNILKLQSMDRGVIQNLKVLYRNRVVKKIMRAIEEKRSYEIDPLEGINGIHKAWGYMKPTAIPNCFRKADLVKSSSLSCRTDIPDEEVVQEDSCTRKLHLLRCDF